MRRVQSLRIITQHEVIHSDSTAKGQFYVHCGFCVEAEQEVLVAVSTMNFYIQHRTTVCY